MVYGRGGGDLPAGVARQVLIIMQRYGYQTIAGKEYYLPICVHKQELKNSSHAPRITKNGQL